MKRCAELSQYTVTDEKIAYHDLLYAYMLLF